MLLFTFENCRHTLRESLYLASPSITTLGSAICHDTQFVQITQEIHTLFDENR